jgi:hypothetical protein
MADVRRIFEVVSDEASFLTGVDVLVDGGCVQGLRGFAAAPEVS